MSKTKKPQEYWYLYTEVECPVCGYGPTYKERVYNKPKPMSYEDRHKSEPSYCGCMNNA